MLLDLSFRYPLISASILTSFWKPFSINVHNFFGIKFCMPFLDAFFSASDACFYQCPPVSCIKIIASTARISRCRRSPRTTIRRHRPVSGVSDKRSQLASLGGLSSLPPGGHLWYLCCSFRGTFELFFGIKFWHHFWHAIFPTFLSFLMDLGFHFGALLASFSILFACLFFASILHGFFINFL